ncbi:MAG: NAD(P)/FAD-dependent oxidoreductase [Candidatus Thermoplasmatota archaeon]|nr:NAD(P)/FAD-dependent oxidoreductase [Candidatus Thermoplasmatota archaeon]
MPKRIVVVGAGAGGGLVASRLRKLLPNGETEITVIDKYGRTDFQPSYTLVALGNREPSQISVDMENFSKTGIRAIKGEVTDVDAQNRTVTVSGQKIPYDILVLSPGVKFDPKSFPGYENAFHFWDMESSMELRKQIATFKGGKIVLGVTTQMYKCPPGTVGNGNDADDYFRLRGIRQNVEITVAHWVQKPMGMFGPVISNPVTKWLEEKDINGIYGFKLSSIDGDKKQLIGESGVTVDYDLAIVAPPHRPSDFVAKNPDLKSPTGWLDSNIRNFRNSRFDDIYGIGDAIAPSIGIGMAGVFAHFQADTAASMIAGDILGSYDPVPYNTIGLCASDTGDAGWIAYCDFRKKLTVPDTLFPDCRSMGRSKILKLAHAIYEKYFLASVYGGWYQ